MSIVGKLRTHISPSAHDVINVVPAQWQIHDALVNSLAAPLGGQVLLCYPYPP